MALQEFLDRGGEQLTVHGPLRARGPDELDMITERRGRAIGNYMEAGILHDEVLRARKQIANTVAGLQTTITYEPIDMGIRTTPDGQARILAYPSLRGLQGGQDMRTYGLTFARLDPRSDIPPGLPDQASTYPQLELGLTLTPSEQDLQDMTGFLGLYSEVAAQALRADGVSSDTWPATVLQRLRESETAPQAETPQ